MLEDKPKSYFYNNRGRKITVELAFIKDCFTKGYTKTTDDAPNYNPVYDKSTQPQTVNNVPGNLSIAMPKEMKGIRRPLEVVRVV